MTSLDLVFVGAQLLVDNTFQVLLYHLAEIVVAAVVDFV